MPIASKVLAAIALVAIECTSAALAQNSCSNVSAIGTWDESKLIEQYGIHTFGTFRIEDEKDEAKQPMFNLTRVTCGEAENYEGIKQLVCKVTSAVVIAETGKPNADHPNCDLDLEADEFYMKEVQKNVLTGMPFFGSTSCYDTVLTIDRNTKRVFRSFIRTKHADGYNKSMEGACRKTAPPTQVLMNCTKWPALRKAMKGTNVASRYCDFSGSSDK